MPKTSKILLLIISIFATGNIVFGQDSTEPTLENLLEKASEQRIIYTDIFKNLIAEETKNIELYDKSGSIKKRRTIISTFIVYETVNNQKVSTAEFRSVLSVDGKPVKNAEKRTRKFFEKIVKAESSEKELQKLADESLRYDLYVTYYGFTLYKGIILAKNLAPFFDFEIVGKESFAENEVFIVSYKQSRESPDLKIESNKDINLNLRMNGLLWIDSKTFQIWREERERIIQPETFEKPVTTSLETYEYQKSEFDILTPKKITLTSYEVNALKKTSDKKAKLTLEYGEFSKPDAEVKSAEIK